jgi:hypothetical protein
VRARTAVRADHDVSGEQDDHVLRLLALSGDDVALFVDDPRAVRSEPCVLARRGVSERAMLPELGDDVVEDDGRGRGHTVRR